MDFDEELDSLDAALKGDEELHALKGRFEHSSLWLEHKKFHEENGGQPRLVVWDEPMPVQADVEQAPTEEQHVRMVKIGGCDCQPRNGFMQISDRGEIVVGIPAPAQEAKAYGTVDTSATTEYGTKSSNAAGPYTLNPSQTRDLYR